MSTFILLFNLHATYSQLVPVEIIVEELFNLLQSGKDFDYIGEPISQLEHALQCAQSARNAGADDETIIAALFHDVGHLCISCNNQLMGSYGKAGHEKIGADYVLKHGFSDKVAALIDGHVQAKRYLTYKDPNYYHQLSPASVKTLEYQGGPMSQEEAERFERDPLFEKKLEMRRWDEAAKIIGADVASLESYKEMIQAHLIKQRCNA